jgi:multicomponent Na+:H+ antiporter subunit D
MMALDHVPVILLAFIFLSSVLVFFLVRLSKGWGEAFALGVAAIAFLATAALYPGVKGGAVLSSSHVFFSFPFSITLQVDLLSYFLALLISFLWLLAVIYSRGYMAHNHALDRYYAFMLACLGACLGVVMAGDLLGLLLFFELMAVTSYVLVAHEEDEAAMYAGGKYIYMAMAAGFALFFSLIITYHLAGSLSLGGGALLTEISPLTLTAFIGFIIGFGIKAGIFPLHVWLPDAHPAAPAPVSALLSGIMLKIGAYGLIRVFFTVFDANMIRQAGWLTIPLAIAVVTILLGSAMALRQDDLKRRLAYSSIAQIGYILLGLSLFSQTALTGAVFHIFTHAMMKGCLFLCAGTIIVRTGLRNISDMKGLAAKMPVTMGCFTLASLSMVGIPPFNGFISKLQLSLGALDVGEPAYVFLLIISSLLNAAYYFPIVVAAFFDKTGHNSGDGKSLEAPLVMLIPMLILAVGTFIFALAPQNWPLDLAQNIARVLFNSL